jgi:lysophospholipase L1-like esterase
MRRISLGSDLLFRTLPLICLLLLALPGLAEPALPKLEGVKRIVFLGDSITQGGDYVTDFECWLAANGIKTEVINLGLGSETASDLTEEENAGHLKAHRFGRPMVSERLDRALTATKPDLLVVCYGMNDGSSLPSNDEGLKRFGDAITHLRDAALKSGVKRVVFCTPPVRDDKGNATLKFHDENLTRFTEWLLTKRAAGWDVVDFHGPMRKALDEGRAKDPAFLLSKDGVHPGREGHWIMARELLTQFLGARLDGVASAEALFPEKGPEIRKLVHQRMGTRFAAWMSQIGHTRPGAPGGPGTKPGQTIEQATESAAAITKQIEALMTAKP